MRKISAHEIALSAVACAFGTIALTVGTLYSPLLFTGYLLAGVATMLPLAKGWYRGSALCWLAASLITLLFNGFNIFDTLPFIVFFGLHPIVNALQLRLNVNRWVALFIKAAWFDGAMYFVWRVVFEATTALPWLDQYFLPILLVGGTLLFFPYDYLTYFIQCCITRVVNKLIKK